MPTSRRAAFIIVNIARMPWCGSPTSQPVAPSKFMTQVAEPLMPILCSMPPQVTPLRGPAAPSACGRNFGTRNRLMPRDARRRVGQAREHQVDDVLGQVVLAGGDEDLGAGDRGRCRRRRARRGCGSGRGRCRTAARSGTSCRVQRARGQLRQIARLQLVGGVRRRARCRRRALRPGYIANDRLAEQTISSTTNLTALGRPWPPYSGSAGEPGPAALDELRRRPP